MKYFIQRGRKGYSDYDIMDLDIYFAKLISESLIEWSRASRAIHDQKDLINAQLIKEVEVVSRVFHILANESVYDIPDANEKASEAYRWLAEKHSQLWI